MKMTKEEKEKVINEMAEMFKDVVYLNAHKRAKETVEKLCTMNMRDMDEITIDYSFKLTKDIMDVFKGRIRRKDNERAKDLNLI